MKIIVTGGAGFIGSNIVNALYQLGGVEIIVVDNFDNGNKFINIKGVPIFDYCDKEIFLQHFSQNYWGKISAVIHQGACSSTVETDGEYMLNSNYHYSKAILELCQSNKIPLLYASSAAVYGLAEICVEEDVHPNLDNRKFDKSAKAIYKSGPLNVYGYSKWLFDQHLRRHLHDYKKKSIPVVGLRYFNVYGEREQHKARMASVAYHLYQQLISDAPMKLFGEHDGYKSGCQKRDFIYIDDVVAVNMFFLNKFFSGKSIKGIYNCGTGKATEFNNIACALAKMQFNLKKNPTANELVAQKKLAYIPFPEDLKGKYQSFTQADLTNLRESGYDKPFIDLYQGITKYWDWLNFINN